MSLSLEHIDACVPITGLRVLALADAKLILQAKGTYTCLIDEESGRLLAKLRTFKGYNIHGFLVLDQKEQNDGGHYVQVIAWGEYSLRLIDLFYANDESHEQTKASLITASAEYLAPDWMLAGCTDESGNAYLVTAHNALLGLRAVSEKTPTYRNAIHLRQLVAGVKTLLYSADITSLSDSHVLIAAGTVFGEVIVWSCFLDNPSSPLGSIHHFFTGHEGSIFGVNISPEIPSLHGNQSGRLLASCSDDRTVRIWDISDCERKTRNDPSTYSTDGFELRSTGFGKEDGRNYELGSECCLAKAFGHISRIWGVRFLPMVGGDRHRLSLLSFGEDATCLLWKLAWETPSEGSDFQLGQVSSFHNHSGKNIFSLDMHRVGPETIIHTGGADGAIKTLRIHEGGDVVNGDSTLKKKGRGPLRAFAFVSSDSFIATSALGEIQLGRIDFDTQNPTPSISKETLCMEEDLRSFSAVTGLPHKGLAVLGNAQGLIRLYNHSTKSLSKIAQVGQRILGIFAADPEPRTYPKSNRSHLSFVTSYANSGRADVFLVSMGQSGEMHIDNIAIELPRNFEVNCASLIWRDEYLVLGSREGGLALFQISNTNPPLQPVTVIRRVHAGTSATGVKMIVPFWSSRGSDTSVEYVMSCGRDGNYCVHELEITGCSEEPINFRTVHRSPSSMNHDLTGAYFNQESHDLMLYGFQHQYFILFNESAQTVLASIDCGGARGHWDFHPGDEPTGGVFLWAQYGILNARRIPSNSSRPLRAGAHGREVKTMEVFNAADKAKTIFATGAEDTTVRIFGPSSPRAESTWGAFKSLRVIKHATSLQQVGFSKDGNFLFASSGLEDFYVWRIRWIPVFGVAAHLMALGPKDDSSSDLRVTSFDILDVEEGGSGQGFLLCLTLSNSTIKILHFSSSGNKGHFTLLARGKYTTNCLTQSRFLRRNSSICLITTSTDGHITLWNLASLEPFYSISPSTISVKASLGTTPENLSCEARYQVHSNSIKSLELVHLSDTVSLLAAGGDDNGLSLSLLETGSEVNARSPVTTISIPDAHAASVTAVKVLNRRHAETAANASTILIASSGNDHRVKIWSIHVDLHRNGPERIDVKNVVDEYSNVADISSLDMVQEDGVLGGSRLLVCGVGMEMLNIRADVL